MSRQKKQLKSLPEEILIEITSKLPPKSLGRLKCVDKSWRSLISSPQFIKKHVRVLATEALHQLDNTIKSDSINRLCQERFFSSFRPDCNPMTGRFVRFKIIGSCNGLVCLCIHEPGSEFLFLLNPCTIEGIKLMESRSENNYSVIHYDFCYYPESDDYMVVKLITAYQPRVKIYSLRENFWTSIDCSHFEVDRIESSVVVGGALIWSVHSGSDNGWIILSLDFKTKRLLEIPQPNYKESSTSNQLLRVLDGCLCVLCETSKICVDVWKMKEYGVKETWFKMGTVTYPIEFISTSGYAKIKTLCNSGVLMYFGTKRVFFNFEKKSFDGAYNIGVQECCDGAGTYMESIVSPKAYQGIGYA